MPLCVSSLSNHLTVLGGVGEVCWSSAGLWDTGWQGNTSPLSAVCSLCQRILILKLKSSFMFLFIQDLDTICFFVVFRSTVIKSWSTHTAQMKNYCTLLFCSGRLCKHEVLQKLNIHEKDFATLLYRPFIGPCWIFFKCLFFVRGGKEFLDLDLDTVFDVNSIVSEVLL